MNQAVAPSQAGAVSQSKPLPARHVLITGRVFSTRRTQSKNGPFSLTVLKLAAPDEFSSPETVELRSEKKLGERGETISVVCRVGGYGRSYDKKETDDDTGEIHRSTVQTADNSLTVVEG